MSMRPGEAGYGDDDRLPWLESVDEDYSDGPSLGRIVLLVFLGLAVVAAIVFGFYWYQKHQGLSGNGELIEAQEGDYKVKPDTPGGMDVEGEGDTQFAASEGDAPNASIDTGAVPEAPVDGTVVKPGATPKGEGAPSVAVPVPESGGALKAKAPVATPVPRISTAGASGALIQLGAFPDRAGAEAAWADLSRKFSVLKPLGHSVEQGESNGKQVYRLRVNAGSNGQASAICKTLSAAGQGCYVAD